MIDKFKLIRLINELREASEEAGRCSFLDESAMERIKAQGKSATLLLEIVELLEERSDIVHLACGSVDCEPGYVFGIYSDEKDAEARLEEVKKSVYCDGYFTYTMVLGAGEDLSV